jgi:hypothetical protein
MSRARAIVPVVLVLVAITGCDAGPGPTGQAPRASTARPDSSERPDPSTVVVDQLGGRWRFSPVVLDDAHVAIVSDACAAKARETLGQDDADLPTALVDARGEHFVTVLMADDLTAIECLARLSDDGDSATVDSVDRLSAVAVAPVEKSAITVASVVHQDDRSGGRTVAFGRVGPDADAAKAGFGDNSTVLASKAEGWWAMWWPGTVRANSYSATDRHDLAVGSAKPPAGEVEARVGRASWWIDPRAAALTPASTDIHAILVEQSCASGDSPEGRVEQPAIELTDTTVTVTYAIRRKVGGQDCPSNPPFAVTLKLPESLGKRTLLDGSETPPRDATKPPAN